MSNFILWQFDERLSFQYKALEGVQLRSIEIWLRNLAKLPMIQIDAEISLYCCQIEATENPRTTEATESSTRG